MGTSPAGGGGGAIVSLHNNNKAKQHISPLCGKSSFNIYKKNHSA